MSHPESNVATFQFLMLYLSLRAMIIYGAEIYREETGLASRCKFASLMSSTGAWRMNIDRRLKPFNFAVAWQYHAHVRSYQWNPFLIGLCTSLYPSGREVKSLCIMNEGSERETRETERWTRWIKRETSTDETNAEESFMEVWTGEVREDKRRKRAFVLFERKRISFETSASKIRLT